MVLQIVAIDGAMSDKQRNKIVQENGQERDLADSRTSAERDREIRKLAKHIS